MGYYDDTMARITREQYEDYIQRFLPYEEKLIDLATSPELLQDQLARNTENVQGQFQSASLSDAQRQSRLGLADSATAQQQTNSDLTQALTLASVQNDTRQAVGDLQDELLSGAASNASQTIKDTVK